MKIELNYQFILIRTTKKGKQKQENCARTITLDFNKFHYEKVLLIIFVVVGVVVKGQSIHIWEHVWLLIVHHGIQWLTTTAQF